MKVSPEQELQSLSQAMLAAAQASDWDRLIELEQARQPLFYQVFDNNTIAAHESLAREVLLLDEAIRQLVLAGLPVIEQQLIKFRNNGMANNAYQSVQNSTLPNDV